VCPPQITSAAATTLPALSRESTVVR
jgi:hypothetical protein